MNGGYTGLAHLTLGLGLDEPDQVPRLARFRAAHPDVIIGPGGFGTWQARIPEPSGETIATRYTLRELLDRLDELTGQQDLDPPPEQTCAGGRDHRVGLEAGCPNYGRLLAACTRRPCSAWRETKR